MDSDQKANASSNKVLVQINFFGPVFEFSQFDRSRAEIQGTMDEHYRSLLEPFFDLPLHALNNDVLERYCDLTKAANLSLVPSYEQLLQRLIEPLRVAKKNYCLGDYISTIALCGMVCEMLTLLTWKISTVRLQGNHIDKTLEEHLLGQEFEKLKQYRRLNILKAFNQINSEDLTKFQRVATIRNSYLHAWSIPQGTEKKDAKEAFKLTMELFISTTGMGLADAGTVKIKPQLLKYLQDGCKPLSI